MLSRLCKQQTLQTGPEHNEQQESQRNIELGIDIFE